jgi:hypothetical protein
MACNRAQIRTPAFLSSRANWSLHPKFRPAVWSLHQEFAGMAESRIGAPGVVIRTKEQTRGQSRETQVVLLS